MRIGLNPHKDQPITDVNFLHQVVMPVYIPHFEGYFEKSFEVLQLSLQSLFQTIHEKTYITIVNNGSCEDVVRFLNQLLQEGKIHEVIHTTNIGKVNAILKGIVGHDIELVTITDADVLFLPNWQSETLKVFRTIPQAGVVGIVPQFCGFKGKSENTLLANLFSKKLKFLPVHNKEALIHFYDSIGWKRDYNPDYLQYTLGLDYSKDFKVIIGSGHFVSTYKRAVFDEVKTYIPFKLGGISESYLDALPLTFDYWRLTTYDNFAYHIGNVTEEWMYDVLSEGKAMTQEEENYNFLTNKTANSTWVQFRNKLFRKAIMNKIVLPIFYKKWGLPKGSIKKY
jgi:hypothetical protein